jgi:chemosensory pili system protein ChpA (sensor histidine kinase/response regulator)
MTTSTTQQGADAIDTGPLSWVMGEIREALTRSKTSLREAVTSDAEAQATALRHAKAFLHQAHGALQIVDIDGIALITETVEDLIDRIESQQLAMSEQVADAVDHAYQALIEYLGELLGGAKHQPVRLFPYYRALLEVRGAERIHPADLFFPNLSVRIQVPASENVPTPDYVALRKRFERALLPFLKNAGDPAHASAMRDIVGEVEAAQTNPHARSFWWVMHAFAEAVASGSVPNEIYIKQLFARVNLQLRRLSEGSASIAERLLRDALFFIARAENPSMRVKQVQAAYQIGGAVPSDYDRKRYGQVDVEALVAAKEKLSQAKNAWNRIAGGDANAADLFGQEMAALAEACVRLESPALSKLLRELNGIARHAAHAPGDAIGLEIATSLLFVENALNNIAQLPDDFTARADAMTARLLAIVSGDRPPLATADWLDDMSKEAQQRQTMTVLASEMQSSLRQVEKTLDEYFNDPSQRAGLEQIGSVLHQIEGALAVLDQDDAMRAVRHVNTVVRRFAMSPDTPDREEFQHVARNVGALSFFIETLQLNPDGARKRFMFDDQEGVFHAKLIEKKPDAPVSDIELDLGTGQIATVEAATDDQSAADAVPTVEEELAYHQLKSAELAVSLSIEPDNPVLQEQLKESLEQVRLEARLVDNPEAGDRARAAIDLLANADLAQKQDALAEIITATVPAHAPAPSSAVPATAMPSSDEAIDAELLEIFLMEADEVLACVRETLPRSRTEPYNQDHLTTLRRSFHTLKGSSRMVGLSLFGEAAWGIEQVLNVRLSETRPGDNDLYALIEKAADFLAEWVAELQANGRSGRSPAAVVAAAERVKAGGAFSWEEAPVAQAPAPEAPVADIVAEPQAQLAEDARHEAREVTELPDAAAIAEMPAAEPLIPDDAFLLDLDLSTGADADVPAELPEATEATLSDADFAAFQESAGAHVETEDDMPSLDFTTGEELPQPVEEKPSVAPVAEIIAFPGLTPPEPRRDDNIRQIGDISISVPLHNIYLAETDELVRVLSQDISEWRHEPDRHVQTHVVHAAHSLAGSSATVGFTPLQEIAHALEMVLQFLLRRPVRLDSGDYDVLEHATERIRFMLQMFALGEMPDHEPQQVELIEHLQRSLEERADAAAAVPAHGIASPSAADMAADGMPELDAELGLPAEEIELEAASDEPEADDGFAAGADLPVPETDIAEPERAATVEDQPHPPVIEALMPPIDAHIHDHEPFAEPVFAHEGEAVNEQVLPVLHDELDADLLPVFLEEGHDMLPQIGRELRAWQQNPADRNPPASLLRLLHTVKGSARMAGAMALGQHLHEMETRIEQLMLIGAPSTIALDDLLARYDAGQHMFDVLQDPEASRKAAAQAAAMQTTAEAAAEPEIGSHGGSDIGAEIAPESLTESAPDADTESDPGATPIAPAAEAVRTGPAEVPALMPNLQGRLGPAPAAAPGPAKTLAPVAAAPLVRVRADILDRLVNQAGEVSISRSKLETEVGGLRQSLSELHENVNRLRDQLRELEVQAESQIASRMQQSGDREFDPLEFDRFTRLQELTRMMAESVNDVGSVQQNLVRTIDSASDDLTTQARLTRELQQDLMRVRMVQFASISERLYRVTRQAAKEVNKRVNLDIRGSAVEMDRSVLEKMSGPFEHLLRNAIVHGIESREQRQAAGKSEVGELRVEIRQEGNEVVIQFADDGRGLDIDRIREKAKATGLLTDDMEMSDVEVGDLIFHPGFSTATEVTELAGRGVGMDVVRSEAAALGGRVSTWSEPGKGAHFTIHLPLTLAVTQVVLMTTGGKTYAVPSVLVEQVQQLKIHALTAAYNDGAVMWQGQRVPLHYLSTLLGDAAATPMSQQYSPILILKSGTERVAVHVDEVIGNREVVVKNIGPQLARMIGVAGATVLGSGDIVLILNPVPLAQRLLHEHPVAPRILPADVPRPMGAVAEVDGSAPAGTGSEPVQGLRTHRIVMVVDDSLTVRRVTQRLLTREGYQVVLAKDGVDALEHLQSITPDAMLVDIEMPRMDGFDLTRNVRSDERTRHIPIIMITSRTAEKHRNYALELGVNEYLGKPYQEEVLLNLIAGFVRKESPVA